MMKVLGCVGRPGRVGAWVWGLVATTAGITGGGGRRQDAPIASGRFGGRRLRSGALALLTTVSVVGSVALTGPVRAEALAPPAEAVSRSIEIMDIAGRKVQVRAPVERVILGEGRQTYFVAVLDTDDPFRRVVGWRDDLAKADPKTYQEYLARFPQIKNVPIVGAMNQGSFNIEQALVLRPDVLLMNLEAKASSDEAKLVEKLGALGIPVVYVDFRYKPLENTEPSMRIIGELFGKEQRAEEFIAFRAREIAVVTDRLKAVGLQGLGNPLVMIDRAAGLSDDCCWSFGRENFGRMVEIAGGRNLGSELLPGTFGTINPEQIVAAKPEVVIATGGSWNALARGGDAWVPLGPGADQTEAREKLAALMRRPAFTTIPATRNGRVHAIWHQFYNSPYQFVAVQRIAKWLHPDLFREVDPSATFAKLHERFLPIPYRPGYWVSLEDSER